ncbi:MAG: hypothetical protein Q8Q09_29585 [Deltaproteobacteria bacterium]|nr:hypothetical protein [Deltaproteobacteria bacterium]
MGSQNHVRIAIRARLDPALLDDTEISLRKRCPTDRAVLTQASLCVRDEVPWFLGFFAVTFTALAILGHVASAHVPGYPLRLRIMPWLFDGLTLGCAVTFFRALYGSTEFRWSDGSLTTLRWLGRRSVMTSTTDPQEVVAIRHTQSQISLEGPQHKVLATPFKTGLLDPPALTHWVAEVLTLAVERGLSQSRSKKAG